MSHIELLSANPLEVFQAWYAEAVASGALSADAMTLATSDASGRPSARTVLYKGVYDGRIGFVSNYASRKGRELEQRPEAALVFFWPSLLRQVRIEGRVERAPAEVSDRYFASRDRESQLGAWASRQSEEVESREQLLAAVEEVRQRFQGVEVTRPPFWGMYLVDPEYMELWMSGEHRLHDRFGYKRNPEGWSARRLSP